MPAYWLQASLGGASGRSRQTRCAGAGLPRSRMGVGLEAGIHGRLAAGAMEPKGLDGLLAVRYPASWSAGCLAARGWRLGCSGSLGREVDLEAVEATIGWALARCGADSGQFPALTSPCRARHLLQGTCGWATVRAARVRRVTPVVGLGPGTITQSSQQYIQS